MKKILVLFLVIIAIITAGCSMISTNHPRTTPTSAHNPTPTPGQNVINPVVTLNDTVNYQVESAYIGKSSSTSGYVYGIIKIKYVGSSSLAFISVNASFKNNSNTQLFTDTSYIYNITSRGSGTTNTNTFFTSTYNEGYYFIIENLDNYSTQLANIAKVDLQLTANTSTYAAPLGSLSANGTPAYQSSDDSWSLNVTNNGDRTVESPFTRFIFKDSGNKMYMWDFPSCYVGGVYDDVFYTSDSGYFKSTYVTPDYLASHLNFGVTILEWTPYTGTSSVRSKLNGIMADKTISVDEKNKLIREQLDELNREKSMQK